MLSTRLLAIRTIQWIAAAAIAAGCGGSTETTTGAPGAGGADSDASAGGTGGSATGGTGGSSVGGSGGTSDGGTGGALADGSLPDTSEPIDASCSVYGQSCDPNADDCCAPLSCVQGSSGARCRLEETDSGLDGAVCAAPQQPCTQLACCPGLDCVPQGPTEICRLPFDGGLPEGGFPEGGTCNDLFKACGPGFGPCCDGLTCTTDPPQYTERQCLPEQTPDPNDCPADEPTPGDACTEVGLQCSYGNMTVCVCYVAGWQCAY